MSDLLKYPRTPHLEGSKLQAGDHDLDQIPLAQLRGRHVVVEEKVDGANCGISFDDDQKLLLQSRGHYLDGGPREEQFALLKTWASCYSQQLWDRLGSRYVMYGEWLYAKHTVFYDALPHYFLEFDLYDRDQQTFLSTTRRREMLKDSPVFSVPVLFEGDGKAMGPPVSWVRPSLYKSSNWRQSLAQQAVASGQSQQQVLKETDSSDLAEGLYLKIEENGVVVERLKWLRYDFLQALTESGSHWRDRPILANLLAEGADLFGSGP